MVTCVFKRLRKKLRLMATMAKNAKQSGRSVRNGNAPSPYTKYGKRPYVYSAAYYQWHHTVKKQKATAPQRIGGPKNAVQSNKRNIYAEAAEQALVMKAVDIQHLKCCAFGRAGSNPVERTKQESKMVAKVTEKTKIIINEGFDIELCIKPHVEKIVKAIKFFDTKYITLITHVQEMDDGTIMVLTEGNVKKG